MNVFIFLGPSLPVEEARRELDAVFLPPVAQGDVYRAARRQPVAISIIDGYFERVPSVWHKEILWAMAQGIPVFGASSMGALRAAELHAFGMEGVGLIFEAFRDGDLQDDDEVAVAHAAQDQQYRAISEAMVNMRCTLGEAQATGVITPSTQTALLEIAKSEFYPHRSYPLLLEKASQAAVPAAEITALREWLPTHRVDQKRDDALALLRHLRRRLEAGLERKQVDYEFAHSDMWDAAMLQAGEMVFDDEGLAHVQEPRVLDELRLRGEAYQAARQASFARVLAIDEARRQNLSVTPELLRQTGDAFRRERELVDPQALREWIQRQHLDYDQFNRLLEHEARLRWMENLMRGEMAYLIPDQLRLDGRYGQLLDRALHKEKTLAAHGQDNPGLADSGIDEQELWQWYFEERLNRTVPDDLDRYAQALDFEDADHLRQSVLREYCYLKITSASEREDTVETYCGDTTVEMPRRDFYEKFLS